MSVFNRFFDSIKVLTKQVTNGQVIILLGLRKKGKSETVKSLCRNISGKKYVVMVDSNLSALPMAADDKSDYQKLPNCTVVEKDADMNWEPGLYIFEDFPVLTQDASDELYSKIIKARHNGMSFLIIAHDYKVLKNTVFAHSNAILLYQDPVITAHQLATKLGGQPNGLKSGHTIIRALKDLQQYHYIFVSFDHKKWHNPFIDSRDVDILKKAIRGTLTPNDLVNIDYPKKQKTATAAKKINTKRSVIIQLLQASVNAEDIKNQTGTTLDTIYKIKSQEKRQYRIQQGWSRNTPDSQYPSWLQDDRRE